ncbi:MAG: NUDIX hydrolase [Proteobacteria bacterium]|nr:NUDIX hydrolase [Pseudomonadota bacterium]MBU2252153.1 NUDIX hydrolase [Pseudomonadota bacterium]
MIMSEAGELRRKLVYRCRIFNVFEGDVRLPNGRVFNQTWIDHRPCVAVVPVNPEGKLVLIRQYRYAAGGMLLEIPAGNMDRQGEAVEVCVQRELAEEVGFQAGRLIKLFEGYLVPGYCNEYMHFFLALDLHPATLPADPDEYIQVVTASFDDAREMIRDGRIIDAKTALGIQLAAQRLEEEKERKS